MNKQFNIWSSRAHKAYMRDYMIASERPFRSAIFLPGWDDAANDGCFCVRRAFEIGAIDEDTQVIAVEWNTALREKITERMSTFPFRNPPILHFDALHRLRLHDRKIDFAMLDLLGNLDWRLARWVVDMLKPNLAEYATVSLTITRSFRRNHFMVNMADAWLRDLELHRTALQVSDEYGIDDSEALLHLLIMKSCLSGFTFDYRRMQIYREPGKHSRTMIAGRFDNIREAKEFGWPSLDEVMAALNNASQSVEASSAKPDRQAAPWESILAHLEKPMEPTPALSLEERRSAAARKAWATRRRIKSADATIPVEAESIPLATPVVEGDQTPELTPEQVLFKKRSAAANQAWATRRAENPKRFPMPEARKRKRKPVRRVVNASAPPKTLFERRSAAARQAWATRRTQNPDRYPTPTQARV
jgi:hypothetical protein